MQRPAPSFCSLKYNDLDKAAKKAIKKAAGSKITVLL